MASQAAQYNETRYIPTAQPISTSRPNLVTNVNSVADLSYPNDSVAAAKTEDTNTRQSSDLPSYADMATTSVTGTAVLYSKPTDEELV